MDTLLVIGRVLSPCCSWARSMGHLTKTGAMTQYAEYRRLPAAKQA